MIFLPLMVSYIRVVVLILLDKKGGREEAQVYLGHNKSLEISSSYTN